MIISIEYIKSEIMFEKLKEKLGIGKKGETKAIDDSLTSGIGKPIGNIKEYTGDLKISLLEADVSLPVSEKISDLLYQKLNGKRIRFGESRDEVLTEAVKSTIKDIATVETPDIMKMAGSKSPFVIMLVGMNGTGKTTSAAKLADIFKKNGFYVVISASDTFRAGAIEQISLHADNLGVKVIKHNAGGDPAAVAFDAIKHASKFKKAVVIVDTAGRMQNNKNLLEEMKKIKRIANPDLIILTLDALSGNDAINQARMFDDAVGLNGFILTKIDADAKGGSILTLLAEMKKPIFFIGNGQNYEDFISFSLDWYLEKLFS